MSDSESIIIRDLNDVSELRTVEELQKRVWGVSDLEVVPALAMIPLREVGGVLIGAFAGQEMVGFVFGFPGHENGKLILHSDMLAVIPEYRSHSLGYHLKLAQRDRAMSNGIKTITWTFDPLQSLNAHLNFGKLGVISDRYCPDYYGKTSSFLHGTGTDRLWVKWHVDSEHVKQRILYGRKTETASTNDVPVNLVVDDDNTPVSVNQEGAQSMLIEIPGEINRVLKEDANLALRWREATRAAFTKALERGFMVQDFFVVERQQRKIGRYLLTTRSSD